MRRIVMLLVVGGAAVTALLLSSRSTDVVAQVGANELDIADMLVEIDGIPDSRGVVAVSGLAFATSIIEVRDGTGNIVGEVVGHTAPAEPTFVLAPGPLATQLWNWYEQVRENGGPRRSMSVVFLNGAREEVFRYNLINCLPKSWRGFRQVGPGAVVTREEVTFHCRHIDRPPR